MGVGLRGESKTRDESEELARRAERVSDENELREAQKREARRD